MRYIRVLPSFNAFKFPLDMAFNVLLATNGAFRWFRGLAKAAISQFEFARARNLCPHPRDRHSIGSWPGGKRKIRELVSQNSAVCGQYRENTLFRIFELVFSRYNNWHPLSRNRLFVYSILVKVILLSILSNEGFHELAGSAGLFAFRLDQSGS